MNASIINPLDFIASGFFDLEGYKLISPNKIKGETHKIFFAMPPALNFVNALIGGFWRFLIVRIVAASVSVSPFVLLGKIGFWLSLV